MIRILRNLLKPSREAVKPSREMVMEQIIEREAKEALPQLEVFWNKVHTELGIEKMGGEPRLRVLNDFPSPAFHYWRKHITPPALVY